MLQIADGALDALRQIGTIRIRGVEAAEDEVELEIEEADEPLMDDQVVERDGATVYLDPVAANALEDQILGVHAHGDHFHFTFDEQPDAAAGPSDS
jgi:Fe-S cluster assembly iron-binding protein IscA